MIDSRYSLLLWALALTGIGVLFLGIRPTEPTRPVASPKTAATLPVRSAIRPLPKVPAIASDKIALGHALFTDTRLSKDNSISCASCHDLSRGGHDPRSLSLGVGGAVGTVNSPSVFNASLNFAQFWDGRASSLAQQAHGPVNNPLEMASNWAEVIAKLQADKPFMQRFESVYPGGLSAENIVDAIAAFEETLLTPDAPFDRFLRGEADAIDAKSREGYRRFTEFGCISCHQGVNVGGNMFQRFGVMGDYFHDRADRVPIREADYGRFNVTHQEVDRYVFKVPGLRNVALTAPYFHDGSASSLKDAVSVMGRYQLGRDLSHEDIESIEAFLHTLTGKTPELAAR